MIIIFFLFYFFDKLPELIILYFAVLLHESAHFLACHILKVRVNQIRFMPYGVNLVTEQIVNPYHNMIISASGPVLSFLMGLLFSTCQGYRLYFFSISNLMVFMLNICPALPLDGGVFVKNLVSLKVGYVKSHYIAMEITRITALVFGVFGIIFLLLSKYNISLLVISAFLVYNLKEEKKKLIFLRKMIYTKTFDCNGNLLNIHHRAVLNGVKAVSLTDCFGYNFICHFFVYDDDMKLMGTIEQSEIIDGIIKNGLGVTIGELIGRN